MNRSISKPFLLQEKGFSVVEALVSLAILGILTFAGLSAFSDINFLNRKIETKQEDRHVAQALRQALMDSKICEANLRPLRAATDQNLAQFFLSADKKVEFFMKNPEFKSASFLLSKKVHFYDNIYSASLRFNKKNPADKSVTISIFFRIVSGRVDSCSSLLNADLASGAGCDISAAGNTRLYAGRTQICNGVRWMPLELNGGMFSMRAYDGNVVCVTPNPATGFCSCPAGNFYAQMGINGIAQRDTSKVGCVKHDGIADYYYDEKLDKLVEVKDRSQPCYFNLIACVGIP